MSERIDAWERWGWLWAALFYATIAASLALALVDENLTAPVAVVVTASVALGVWHGGGLWLVGRSRPGWEEGAGARLSVILGDAALWIVLVSMSPAYYLALFALFAQVFRHLPIRYALAAAGLLAAGTVAEQVADEGTITVSSPTLWLSLAAGAAAIATGAWVWTIIEQSSRRRDLIAQLQAAQDARAEAERHAGVLAERQRLAREIHDTLAQDFVSIILHLEAAGAARPPTSEDSANHIQQASATARSGLDQARKVVHDLRPSQLDHNALDEAIQRWSTKWGAEVGISVAAVTTGEVVRQPVEVEATLLRVIQEALNNVRKHARATSVQVTLSYLEDSVILDVHDDGVGFAGAEPSPFAGGFGLESMRQRVADQGGTMTLESEPGEGTTLAVAIPLRETNTDETTERP